MLWTLWTAPVVPYVCNYSFSFISSPGTPNNPFATPTSLARYLTFESVLYAPILFLYVYTLPSLDNAPAHYIATTVSKIISIIYFLFLFVWLFFVGNTLLYTNALRQTTKRPFLKQIMYFSLFGGLLWRAGPCFTGGVDSSNPSGIIGLILMGISVIAMYNVMIADSIESMTDGGRKLNLTTARFMITSGTHTIIKLPT